MKKTGAGSAKRVLLIALGCVLAVAAAGILLVAILTNDLLGQIQRPTETPTLSSSEIEDILHGDTPTGTGPTITQEDIDFGTEPTETIAADELVNILLIGKDTNRNNDRNNSDVMILCTVNKTAKTLTMTSFLRDIYVQIPGFGGNKLNACYPLGGMELLDACLEENFGVQVDANIAVDFRSFMKLIDMAGGVDIRLTQEEASYMNKTGNWAVTKYEKWYLKEGENTLTGTQALAYARIRYLGTDLERTNRQRKVVPALLEKAGDMNPAELYNLAKEGAAALTTDMTDSQILEYIAEFVPMLTDLKVSSQRIPVDDSYSFRDVGSVGDCVVIDFDVNRKLLADTLNP